LYDIELIVCVVEATWSRSYKHMKIDASIETVAIDTTATATVIAVGSGVSGGVGGGGVSGGAGCNHSDRMFNKGVGGCDTPFKTIDT
jgi:uncharacterized membrane protein